MLPSRYFSDLTQPEIAAQFKALVNAQSGTSDAVVYSAFAIDAAALAHHLPATDGVGDAVSGQPKQLRAGCGCAENPAGRCNVPASRIVARRNRIADAALDLYPENKRRQHIAPWKLARFCQGDHRCRDRCRRMDDRFRMRVVKIQQIGRDRVDERSTHRI